MKKKNYETIYFFVALILLVGIFVYGVITLLNRNDDNNVLLDNSKTIVYTIYEDKELNKSVPNINIKDVSTKVNKEIIDLVNPYLDKETNNISYKFQINGNILSLLLMIEDFEIEGTLDVVFLSYNIDLDKLKVLSNKEVLDMFDLDMNYIEKELDNKFNTFYNNELHNKSIKDISYSEYLKSHNIDNFKDLVYLTINKGKLNVYLDYNFWSNNETDSYLSDVGYVFEVD